MDIRKESLEDGQVGYLNSKLGKIMGFFKLLIPNLSIEETNELEESVVKAFNIKGITFEDESLYDSNGEFKKSKDMPIIEDVQKLCTKDLQEKLNPLVNGSLRFFNDHTNVELKSNLIVGDVYELDDENMKLGMYVLMEIFWDKIKADREREKVIYIDEIWRLIGITTNDQVASFIYKIFKTIRKYRGSGVAITQDISDLFSYKDGAYGKTLFNNSEFKVFFQMEEENIKVLEKNFNLSQKEKVKLISLPRGNCIISLGKIQCNLKVISAGFERAYIEEC